MRTVCYQVMLIILMCFSFAYAEPALAESSESNKQSLKVGVINSVAHMPLWGGINNSPTGVLHDIWSYIATASNLKYEYVGFDSFHSIVEAANRGDIDIILGVVESPQRRMMFDFSLPIYENNYAVWIADSINVGKEIKSLRLACAAGTIACDIFRSFGYKNIIEIENDDKFYEGILNGDFDGAIQLDSTLRYFLSANMVSKGEMYYEPQWENYFTRIAVTKVNSSLINVINKVIESHGFSDFTKWVINEYKLNSENKIDIKNNLEDRTITYSVEENAFPLSYWNEDEGRFVGYVHDLLALISARTSLHFQYVPPAGESLDSMLLRGEVDVLPAKSSLLRNTNEFIATRPYTELKFSYLETKRPFKEKVVGVLDRLNILSLPNTKTYKNIDLIISDLENGLLTNAYMNAYLVDSIFASKQDVNFIVLPKTESPVVDVPMSMVFSKDKLELKLLLESALDTFTTREIENIWNNYKTIDYHWGVDTEKVYASFYFVLIFLIFLGFLVFYNFRKLSGLVKSSNRKFIDSQKRTQWLSLLIDSIPSMICIIDKDGNLLLSNEKYHNTITSNDSGFNQDFVDKVIDKLPLNESGKMNELFETRGTSSNGNVSFYNVICNAFDDPITQQEIRVVVFEDYTIIKNNEVKLTGLYKLAEQSVESQKLFLAIISHELRTPISSMLGLMKLLPKKLADNEDKLTLDNAISSAERLKLLVDDILDYSKLDANQLAINVEEFNVAIELSPVIRGFEAAATNKGLMFSLQWVPTKWLELEGDVMRVIQIVSNILSNAIKFTERGYIVVGLSVANNEFNFTVRDSGIGMDANQLSHIYKPFTQSEGSIARRFGGTGLGMSIVKSLVSLMAGRIEIESKLGMGTMVSVTLPLAAEPLKVNTNKVLTLAVGDELTKAWLHELDIKYIENINEAKLKTNFYPDSLITQLTQDDGELLVDNEFEKLSGEVIVVDDDPVNRYLADKQLRDFGLIPTIVSSGAEALDVLQSSTTQFDVIVTDLHMPDMNGFELCKMVRARDWSLSNIPIFALTADNSINVETLAKSSGIDQVIYKPYEIKQLYEALSKCLLKETRNRGKGDERRWLSNFDESNRAEMAKIVVDSFTEVLNEIANGDCDVKLLAHRVKGSASTLALTKLAEVATRLEATPRSEELIEEFVQILRLEIRNAKGYLGEV